MKIDYQGLDSLPTPIKLVSDTRKAVLLVPEEDPTVWISKSGDITPISNMTCSHLMHAIKLQEREIRFDQRYICLVSEALSRDLVKSILTVLV